VGDVLARRRVADRLRVEGRIDFVREREEPMPPVTRYQLWQHAKSRELWAVRLEFDTLTGVFGPLEAPARSVDLSGLLYEDHPDDFEWLFRAADDFTVVRESA
jgi:hypothetical protein